MGTRPPSTQPSRRRRHYQARDRLNVREAQDDQTMSPGERDPPGAASENAKRRRMHVFALERAAQIVPPTAAAAAAARFVAAAPAPSA